jgi:hypothetical protein
VIELCDIINRHCVILASLSTDATNHVKYNTNLLSHLIGLLPGSYEDKWYDHITSQLWSCQRVPTSTCWSYLLGESPSHQRLTPTYATSVLLWCAFHQPCILWSCQRVPTTYYAYSGLPRECLPVLAGPTYWVQPASPATNTYLTTPLILSTFSPVLRG